MPIHLIIGKYYYTTQELATLIYVKCQKRIQFLSKVTKKLKYNFFDDRLKVIVYNLFFYNKYEFNKL